MFPSTNEVFASADLVSDQLYAAISSLSLSLFATCIDAGTPMLGLPYTSCLRDLIVIFDSVFDPFANIVLNYLHKRSTRVDEKKWPMGGSRFESSESSCVGVFIVKY